MLPFFRSLGMLGMHERAVGFLVSSFKASSTKKEPKQEPRPVNLVMALGKCLVLPESMANSRCFQRGQDFTLCSSQTKLPVLGKINKTFESDACKVKLQCAYVRKMCVALCQ